jgi:hypothetical protein
LHHQPLVLLHHPVIAIGPARVRRLGCNAQCPQRQTDGRGLGFHQLAADTVMALYVVNYGTGVNYGTNGTIGVYNASTGAAINASLVTGLPNVGGIALDSSGHLFVVILNHIAEYNASTGAVINSQFITNLGLGACVALDGAGHLFVTQQYYNSVAEYNASTGALINFSLVTGLNSPTGLTGQLWPSVRIKPQ